MHFELKLYDFQCVQNVYAACICDYLNGAIKIRAFVVYNIKTGEQTGFCK